MKRRLLCLLLAVVMLVASLPLNVVAASIYQAQSNSRQTEQLPFNDVKKGAWYYDAVEYAYRHNLFNGTE